MRYSSVYPLDCRSGCNYFAGSGRRMRYVQHRIFAKGILSAPGCLLFRYNGRFVILHRKLDLSYYTGDIPDETMVCYLPFFTLE